MTRKTVIEVIAFLFILLFVYAAVSKLVDFARFKVQLGQSPILTTYAELVAWIIPLSELALSLLLVTKKFRLIAFYGAFSLMVIFTDYIIAITRFSDYIPCSCGGVLQDMTWNQHLVFNICFILLAATAILLIENSNTAVGAYKEHPG